MLQRNLIRTTSKQTCIKYHRVCSRAFSVQSDEEIIRRTFANLDLSLNEVNAGVYDGNWHKSSQTNVSYNPTTASKIGEVSFGSTKDYENVIQSMNKVKKDWANTPAPIRGEVVRLIGEELRTYKEDLSAMVSIEMGKIYTEGLGEVQEAIDICDYAVGLSRMINGKVIPSERPDHFMMERYNSLKGHVGIISAFNFPVAVYFWNLAISLVCGNTNLWKPCESASMISVATTKIVAKALAKANQPGAIASMICGNGADVGNALVADDRMELVSFTGSTHVGKGVSQVVAGRFGRSILELGGNNCMIVDKSADIGMAVRATLFGAVGTCGQRCTTQRRTIVHQDVYDDFVERLVKGYKSIPMGSPLDPKTLCGPLHNQAAVDTFHRTIEKAKEQGGKVIVGGSSANIDLKGHFVNPAVVEFDSIAPVMKEENFVPIMYVAKYDGDLDKAIHINNDVRQGLSSALFTKDPEQLFHWTGQNGSDCGIVNVNIGTSGAEIGGAFGGEKETGGGRESGSDAWKQYMRRSTCTINHSKSLPLAQGVNFGD